MGRAFEFRKARKMKRWSAMSKAFTRIGKDIVMAVLKNKYYNSLLLKLSCLKHDHYLVVDVLEVCYI